MPQTFHVFPFCSSIFISDVTVHEEVCVCARACAYIVCVCVHVYVCVCVFNKYIRDTFVVTLLLVCWHNYCDVVRVCINW